MNSNNILINSLIFSIISVHGIATLSQEANAQTTNNNTTVTNSAAPAASSVTTGGTNINYQTNNAFSNDLGFGPGIICRTPSFFVLSNVGKVSTDNFDEFTFNGARNKSINGTFGLTFPFGSSAIEDCKTMARQLARDRVISTELSYIKTCASLAKEGIVVDPNKFPSLKKCFLKEGDPNLTATGIIRKNQSKVNPNNSKKNMNIKQLPKSPLLSTD